MKRTLSLSRANNPVKEEDGSVFGKIMEVSAEQEEIKRPGEDAVDVDYTIFHFETTGSAGRPIKIKHKCSTKLNGEKYLVKDGGSKSSKKEYNKLTRTCLQLGLISEEELLDLTDEILERVAKELEGLQEISVKFKLTNDKKRHFFGISLKSLELV